MDAQLRRDMQLGNAYFFSICNSNYSQADTFGCVYGLCL